MPVCVLRATRRGADVVGGAAGKRRYDASVRLEDIEGDLLIAVDVFDSSQPMPRAHVESQVFDNDASGAKEATDFLAGYGFKHVRVETSSRRRSHADGY